MTPEVDRNLRVVGRKRLYGARPDKYPSRGGSGEAAE
jgi:hypothetical protein